MKAYWKPVKTQVKAMTEKATKEDICQTLMQIKRDHIPNWDYESHGGLSLPNEHYLLHVAIQTALLAVQTMDDDLFNRCIEQINQDKR